MLQNAREGMTRADRPAYNGDMGDANQDLLLFILRYLRENGFQPTTQEMADHFGVTVPTVNNRLWKLEEEGYLARVGGRALRIKHLEVNLKFKEERSS